MILCYYKKYKYGKKEVIVLKETVKYWLDIAEYDLETAKAMLATRRYLYVGFMCHQTIEKALKAILSKQEFELVPKVHNIVKLAKQSNMYNNMTEKEKDFLEMLLPLNIEARYPSHKQRMLESLNEENCKQLILNTEDLLCLIKKELYK